MVNALIMLGAIKLLDLTDKPIYSALMVSIAYFVLALLWGGTLVVSFISTLIYFAVSYGYFWLLYRTGDSWIWWVIVIIGVVVAFL